MLTNDNQFHIPVKGSNTFQRQIFWDLHNRCVYKKKRRILHDRFVHVYSLSNKSLLKTRSVKIALESHMQRSV